VNSEWTRMVCLMTQNEKQSYSAKMQKSSSLPRLLWINKQSTLK
jgi:hypothetical protein